MTPKQNGSPIPAVAYVRMSGDKQEASPEQQRAEVAKLAKREGYRVLREYFDPAISGDLTEKRKAFQRMIRDAEEKGDFCAVLCWDQDRFGRFDSIEAGHWIHPLRQAGVWLHTIAQGRIDWNEFAGRMMFGIVQEGKHQFLLDLSRNSLRGRIEAAKRGALFHKPAYGYDRVFHDEKGEFVRRVRYGETFSKPKNWSVKFVPSDDPAVLKTVRWIFDTFATSDCSIQWLTAELNARGTPGKPSGTWTCRGLRYFLTNRVYVGTRSYGQRRSGKYHEIDETGVVAKQNGKASRPAPIVVEHAHEELIEPAVFQAVQDKLAERARGKLRPRHSGYVLSGILKCGHCGAILAGDACGKQTGPKVRRYYRCRNKGNEVPTCPSGRIRQDEIEDYVITWLCKQIMAPEALKRIRRMFYHEAKARKRSQGDTKGLQARIAALDRKIAKGTENLLLADAEDVPEMTRLLAGWRKDRTEAQSQLEAAATKPGGRTPEQLTEAAMNELTRLKGLLRGGNPQQVRAAIKSMIAEIPVLWEANGKGKRVARGVIVMRSRRGVIGSITGRGSSRSP